MPELTLKLTISIRRDYITIITCTSSRINPLCTHDAMIGYAICTCPLEQRTLRCAFCMIKGECGIVSSQLQVILTNVIKRIPSFIAMDIHRRTGGFACTPGSDVAGYGEGLFVDIDGEDVLHA